MLSSFNPNGSLTLSFLRTYKHPETGIDCQEVVSVHLWSIERSLQEQHRFFSDGEQINHEQAFHFLRLNIDHRNEVMQALEKEKQQRNPFGIPVL